MSAPVRRHPNVLNLDEAEPMERMVGTRFGGVMRRVAKPAGAEKLGATFYEIPPGRSAMPAHYHCQNEEALFIMDGAGTLRIGEQRVPVRAGDWVSLPVGPAYAHRLENTGTETLRYLCLSTMSTAEVCGYPDSGKVAALGSPDGGGPGSQPWVAMWVKGDAGVGYFEGEDVG